jgi:hypothetical protein
MRFVDEARVYVQAGAVADHDAANRHQPTPSTPFTCRIVHVGQASRARAVRQAFARCEADGFAPAERASRLRAVTKKDLRNPPS